ncbi:MAG: NAD(P)-binding protein [Rhodobiaceae bacterium]|nr:NAD(P)-binding protein [Rhodobiaceae bacterium]MCC0015202.1 NAD(P)-binding protein [Rhodobiaceae bacterium]MCC0040730.1 NAD(P)-binding protein [Rhodobiaceae bacterium]MCC0053557.1 NAD(P)-binding protein [Rhodobiaceae bacterium]
MNTRLADFTPRVDLTVARGTGPVRDKRPVYVTLTPPCAHACPAGEDIRGWLALAQAGRYREAWQHLVAENPMPAVHGRVCYHPCESGCNRGEVDTAVSIHAVERYLGDLATSQGWAYPAPAPATGRKVLVVGAGPCGLSAAYHLARLGHEVEIREAGPVAGGMMHFGIPAYRMPREDLAAEVARIEALGVRIVTGHKVEDLMQEKQEGGFDAVFVAIGAGLGKRVDIPTRDAARVLDAVTLLHETSEGRPPLLGRRVVVYGGGNTAMDTARTARRLGASETLIVYRRDREHMPAHAFEADEAVEEGVKIKWLTTITEISGSDLTVERMELDEGGRPQPTGEFETLSADAVVLALGQQSDSNFLRKVPGIVFTRDGAVEVGADLMTGEPGVFAGGDLVPGEQSVTISVGHGKRAARHIDAWLSDRTYQESEPPPVVDFGKLHLPVYSDAEQRQQAALQGAGRLSGFDEIVAGLSEREARYEAQRCYSCGDCYECDNCFAACPEEAILKLGPGLRYEFNYDRCTGCATCFDQCPCHAIEMTAEASRNG